MIDSMNLFASIPWWAYALFMFFLLTSFLEPKKKKKHNSLKYNKYIPANNVNGNEKGLCKSITSKKNNKGLISVKCKGSNYKEHVCKYFENLGYKTVKYGKIHGPKDKDIDLMLKKGKEFIFVQCKDLDIKNKYRIDSKEIQYTRMNVRDYIENTKALFDMYEWKIFYITSDNILDKSAEHKINRHREEIEHQVIKI